jgi:hypothetical protein
VQDRGQDQAGENQGGGKTGAERFHTAICSALKVDVRAQRDKSITDGRAEPFGKAEDEGCGNCAKAESRGSDMQ